MNPDEERLLRYLDHPLPPVSADDIAARARTSVRRIRLRWAAGVVLAAVLTGTAVATPGSPVRRWIASLVARQQAPLPPITAPAPESMAGIAIVPGQALVIEFTREQFAGFVRVTLTAGDQVHIRAPAGAASFSSDPDRLVIDNQGSSADFAIDLPRVAPRIVIRVAGVRVLLKQGDRVTLTRGTGEPGSWSVPLTAPR